MRRLSPHITLHSFLVPHLWLKDQGQADCVPKIIVSFHLSWALSLAPHRTPSTSSSTISSVPGLQRLLTSRISCADPRGPRGDGQTDPEPRTGTGHPTESCGVIFIKVPAEFEGQPELVAEVPGKFIRFSPDGRPLHTLSLSRTVALDGDCSGASGHSVATVACLLFEGEARIDMRYVPKDVKKMLL